MSCAVILYSFNLVSRYDKKSWKELGKISLHTNISLAYGLKGYAHISFLCVVYHCMELVLKR